MIDIGSLESVNAFLKKSRMFLSSAKGNIDRRLYDVACFEAEQAAQLFLKAYVLKSSGVVPRTHSVRRLLGHLASTSEANKKAIIRFASERRSDLIMLEDAYLRSRYSGEAYNRQDAKRCVDVAEEVTDFVKRVIVDS